MTSPLKIGIVMDPINAINFKKDSSLALLFAVQARGHAIFYMEQSDLYIDNGKAHALMRPLKVFNDKSHWFELQELENRSLSDLHIILMRKDPPFDNHFLQTTYILEQAEREGALVVNKAQSLRDCNEKLFATQFPDCCPPHLVSQNSALLKQFHQKHGDVIFKPLEGMGGTGVFRCTAEDPNVSVILETLTEMGQSCIMAQKFIPEISNGDKRILVVNGEAIPYSLARIPAQGETRGNLAAGGRGVAQKLTARDHWIVEQVAPTLMEKGLLFVGLDVIGDYLTEINVTSPTCVREIDAAYDTGIGEKLVLALESLVNVP